MIRGHGSAWLATMLSAGSVGQPANAACPRSGQVSLQQQMASTVMRDLQLEPHAAHQPAAVCHRLTAAVQASLQPVAIAANPALQLKACALPQYMHVHSHAEFCQLAPVLRMLVSSKC